MIVNNTCVGGLLYHFPPSAKYNRPQRQLVWRLLTFFSFDLEAKNSNNLLLSISVITVQENSHKIDHKKKRLALDSLEHKSRAHWYRRATKGEHF